MLWKKATGIYTGIVQLLKLIQLSSVNVGPSIYFYAVTQLVYCFEVQNGVNVCDRLCKMESQ